MEKRTFRLESTLPSKETVKAEEPRVPKPLVHDAKKVEMVWQQKFSSFSLNPKNVSKLKVKLMNTLI